MKHESQISFTDPSKLQESLNLLVAGSDKAFNMLYKTYRRRLYSFAAHRGLSDHDAQVIADDTLLAFCDKATNFVNADGADTVSEVRSYLFGMASKKINSIWRTKYRIADIEKDDREEEIAGAFADESMDIALSMEFKQDQEALMHCLDRLSWKKRSALVLYYWNEFTYEDLRKEQEEEESVGTVKSRLSAAKAALKACFENWINGGRYTALKST